MIVKLNAVGILGLSPNKTVITRFRRIIVFGNRSREIKVCSQYSRVCGVLTVHTEKISTILPLVLRYSNITIYLHRHNAIPTAILEMSRWDGRIFNCEWLLFLFTGHIGK
jgi:hypothetical protein